MLVLVSFWLLDHVYQVNTSLESGLKHLQWKNRAHISVTSTEVRSMYKKIWSLSAVFRLCGAVQVYHLTKQESQWLSFHSELMLSDKEGFLWWLHLFVTLLISIHCGILVAEHGCGQGSNQGLQLTTTMHHTEKFSALLPSSNLTLRNSQHQWIAMTTTEATCVSAWYSVRLTTYKACAFVFLYMMLIPASWLQAKYCASQHLWQWF